MITEEKIKEIRKMVRSGIPEGEIKENLVREGYSKEDIDKAFAPQRYDMRSWYMFFGILIFILGTWIYLRTGSFLVIILSALLFAQYSKEILRLKKRD